MPEISLFWASCSRQISHEMSEQRFTSSGQMYLFLFPLTQSVRVPKERLASLPKGILTLPKTRIILYNHNVFATYSARLVQ